MDKLALIAAVLADGAAALAVLLAFSARRHVRRRSSVEMRDGPRRHGR